MLQPRYLPMTRADMRLVGWDELDVLLISGDAYIDHPSFGVALLGRWLVAHGFRVGVAAQPRWRDREAVLADIAAMGRPRLFAGVTAGAIDSMLAHYTAFRKKRHDDAYTPGGLAGARPNRACMVYTGLARQAFPGLPVVLGGIEASLRRAAHYDFWDDALRRPLLQDSKADLLVYGMGERALLEIALRAERMLAETDSTKRESGRAALTAACRDILGTAWMASPADAREWVDRQTFAPGTAKTTAAPVALPGYEDMLAEPALLMRATLELESLVHSGGRYAVQPSGDRVLVLAPPAPPLDQEGMDLLYSLPYARLPHPGYTQPVPAWEMIRTSITTHRGCGGGCSFCSLALHQGRRISSRSRVSVMNEAAAIAAGPAPFESGTGRRPPRWAGSISDVGGPSANMWQGLCTLAKDTNCSRSSCLHPTPCPFFKVDQGKGVRLLRDISALPGVRHVRVASGVRFDLALQDPEALWAYTSEFTGGQLKVAPEHSEDEVLSLMRKPGLRVFERFLEAFAAHCRKAGKEQYAIPYLMSAFPGCTQAHMRALAAWLRRKNWRPQQVQCFIPTPGTVATAMFYGGINPKGEALYVARSDKERLGQHHLLVEGERGGRRVK